MSQREGSGEIIIEMWSLSGGKDMGPEQNQNVKRVILDFQLITLIAS